MLILTTHARTIYTMEATLISRSSTTALDPLSDILALVRTRGFVSGGLDLGGDWAYAFPSDGAFRCFAVMSGSCWLSPSDGSQAVRFLKGDVFALPHGTAFSLSSDPAIAPQDIYEVITGPLNGQVLTLNGGGSCCLFGTLFTFRPHFASHLLNLLPSILYVSDAHDRAALKGYLDRMMGLLRSPRPGSFRTAELLAETMLIEILVLQLAQGKATSVGWLFALADKQLSRAITAIHEQPGRSWTVQMLAECACMSRSAFSLRFKKMAGVTVMEYLTRWRMLLASDRVSSSSDSIGTIARSLGYESESAFVFAFRRELGCTPRQFGLRTAGGYS